MNTPVQVAERLLNETRDQVRRADARATAGLQAVAGGGFTVVTLVSGRPGTAGALWPVAGGLWALAVLCLLGALVPRLTGPRDVTSFVHVARLGSTARITAGIEAAAADLLPGTVGELRALSRIALIKYRLIRAAAFLSCAAALAAGIGLR
ncbi:Pycsar system effector family protein [Actinoplanes sp. N902-109]|uniref:Pycsar system effector family protein n=1 Tax=Actinoplanes sp. (strain N902-109) TaxID=649831 RepID=UPI0003295481|nr:Pycsar system effector family protein [Actinoplanes sp. N902-109]AGL18769.1 hypothetical protein L083_5259 [Actinoplanes sp. N902-109]